MNSTILVNIARFVLLILAQVLIFNKFNFLGYINPYPYILFIILYPVDGNKYSLLTASFLLGLTLDFFMNSGGIHAIACITLAAVRPYLYKVSFGISYEYQTVRINDVLTPERFSFIFLSVLIHHLLLFVLEIFSTEYIWGIILRTLVSTAFTIILCIFIIYLFKPSKQ